MKEELSVEFGKRLKNLRLDSEWIMDDVCAIYNEKFNAKLNKSTLSRYENGTQEALFSTVKNLSELFGVTIEYMTGKTNNKYGEVNTIYFKKTIPLLGVIAAGQPIYAEENIQGYEPTENASLDFCLKVKGDSMIGARIYDGDIVYVDTNAVIENGDIVVALVDGENATLKRYFRYGNTVILRPENTLLKEMEFNFKDKEFKIIGKVKEVKFKV